MAYVVNLSAARTTESMLMFLFTTESKDFNFTYMTCVRSGFNTVYVFRNYSLEKQK